MEQANSTAYLIFQTTLLLEIPQKDIQITQTLLSPKWFR